jgi:hypothetical protein
MPSAQQREKRGEGVDTVIVPLTWEWTSGGGVDVLGGGGGWGRSRLGGVEEGRGRGAGVGGGRRYSGDSGESEYHLADGIRWVSARD